MSIHDMLVTYQKVNQKRLIEVHKMLGDQTIPPLKQVVSPPDPASNLEVPTLEPGFYKRMTPLLKSRFEYAGAWKEADAGHEWLSLKGMEAAIRNPKVLEQIKMRIETWTDSPLARLPASRISLFGLYGDQSEEIYLIWPLADGDEPQILSYSGNFEAKFSDFAQYLKHLIDG